MAISERITAFCFRKVPIQPLVAFRIIFGALAIFSAVRFMSYGWVDSLYIQPSFHFHYLLFEWVNPLPGNWMYLPFMLMILGGIGIMLGAFYRISAFTYFISFTYIELLDKTTYLNHYYFVSIMMFLLILLPANQDISLDARWQRVTRNKEVGYWTIWILRFQLTLVYFYAGIAKINSDWLIEAMPLKIWLQGNRDLPLIGGLFASTWLAYAFSWFGCVYDLCIPFLLMRPKTRNWAYIFVIVFHIVTWLLFPIGVFPWVMMGATLIFFPASWHERWLQHLRQRESSSLKATTQVVKNKSQILISFLVIFVASQILIPFRYVLYSGELFWYEQGFRFSWRVMLMEKKGYVTFYVVDNAYKGALTVNNMDHLTDFQIDQMSRQPDMILEFAHYLGKQYKDTTINLGAKKVHFSADKVEAECFVALNGKMNAPYVTRRINLLSISKFQPYNTWVESPSH